MITLEVGKSYKAKNGDVFKVIDFDPDEGAGKLDYVCSDGFYRTFQGVVFPSGIFSDNQYDAVELV